MLPLGAFSAYGLSAEDPNYFKSKHYLYEEEHDGAYHLTRFVSCRPVETPGWSGLISVFTRLMAHLSLCKILYATYSPYPLAALHNTLRR